MRRIINTVVIVILSITTLGFLVYAFDQQIEAEWNRELAYQNMQDADSMRTELEEMHGEWKMNFSALIVNEMDVSVNWYCGMLGFEVVDSTINEERGIKQYNLESGAARLELIEISSAVDPPDGRVKGIFKIGYSVADFDSWINRLESQVSPNDIVIDPVSGKRTIVFTDPDGNRIQLFEQ